MISFLFVVITLGLNINVTVVTFILVNDIFCQLSSGYILEEILFKSKKLVMITEYNIYNQKVSFYYKSYSKLIYRNDIWLHLCF